MPDSRSLVFRFFGEDVNAGRTFDKLALQTEHLSTKFLGLNKGLAVGLGAVAVAAAATGAVAIKMGAQFQSSMERIHTQAGASQAEVNGLSKAVLGLAGKVAQSPDELAQGLYHIESAGFRGAAAMKMLQAAAQGATIGNANLEDVTQAMIATMASGIKGVSGASDAMALLNQTVGIGDMKMEQLSQALATGILPSARSAGLGMNDVAASLATITDNATPADEAATRLRMTFALMSSPSAAAAHALKTIGLSSTTMASDMRKPDGLLVALQDLKSHLETSGKSAVEQNQVIERAFGGGKTSGAILTLLGEMDRLKSKYEELGTSTSRAAAFQESWAKTQDTFTVQLRKARDSIDALGIHLGMHLLPAATQVLKFFTSNFLPGMEAVFAHVPQLIRNVKEFVEGALGTPSKWTSAVSAGINARFALETRGLHLEKFTALGGKIRDAIVGGFNVAKGINIGEFIAGAFGSPKTWTDSVSKGVDFRFMLNSLPDQIAKMDWSKVAKAAVDALVAALTDLADGAGKIADGLLKLLGKVDWVGLGIDAGKIAAPLAVGLLAGFVNALFDPSTLAAVWRHKGDIIMAILAVLPIKAKWIEAAAKWADKIPVVGALISHLFGAAARIKKPIDDFFGWVWDRVKVGFGDGFGKTLPSVTKFFERLLGGIKGKFADVGTWIYVHVDDFFKALGRGFGGIARRVWDAGSGFIGGLASGIGTRLAGLVKWLGGIPGALLRGVGSLLDTLRGAGGDLIAGLGTGITDGLKVVGSWAKTIKDAIIGAVKSAFGISSPSKVMMEYGGHIMSGLLHGMLSGKDALESVVKSVFHSPLDAAKSLIHNGVHLLGTLGGKFSSALGGLLGFGGGGGVSGGNAMGRAAVLEAARGQGWASGPEWDALQRVLMRESGFNPTAQNPTSTAYGMFQFLNSTWGAYGIPKTSDPHLQAIAGLRYIASRYRDPIGAYAHEQQFGWYDQLGYIPKGVSLSVNTLKGGRKDIAGPTDDFARIVGRELDKRGVGRSGGNTVNVVQTDPSPHAVLRALRLAGV